VACQDQCPPSEPCRCLRHIVHVDALIAWLGRKLTEVYENTNLHRLLMELQLGDHRTFPLDYETYFTGELKCVRVFSLLLKQDRGHLIDRFYQSQMYDMILHQDGNYEGLRENLSDTTASCDAVELIIDEFQREKWTFCPLELQLHMDRPLEGTRVIVPFCHKIKLNEGGTASVYLVAVQEDLIRDERLKAELKDSLYEDLVHGKVRLWQQLINFRLLCTIVLQNGPQVLLWQQEECFRIGKRCIFRFEVKHRRAHSPIPGEFHTRLRRRYQIPRPSRKENLQSPP
jgi:hypothetical protein